VLKRANLSFITKEHVTTKSTILVDRSFVSR
jgi:hypothetical protein